MEAKEMCARQFTQPTLRGFASLLFAPIAFYTLLLAPGAANGQSAAPAAQAQSARSAAKPPVAPVRVVTDEYFGVKVDDPYRYFENLKDAEVAAWFKAENDYTRQQLGAIPGREAMQARLKELTDSTPAAVSDIRRMPGDTYFYMKRLASEEVGKLYTRAGLSGAEKLLVDPAKFAGGSGAHAVISYYAVSQDGRWVVAGLSLAGSEDATIHIFEVQTGKESGETIDRAQFGGPSWLPDGHSFTYNRLQKLGPSSGPNDKELLSRVYLHVVGTDPEKDRLIFGDGAPGAKFAPTDLPFVQAVPDSKYAIGFVLHGVAIEATLYVAPVASLASGNIPWKKLCDVDDEVTSLDYKGDDVYLLSHKNAPRFQVLHTTLSNPEVAHATVVVPESQAVIKGLSAAADAVYVQQLDGGLGRLLRVPYASGSAQPAPQQVTLPAEGIISIAAADQRVPGVLLTIDSWTKAQSIYAYDPANGKTMDTKLQPLGPYDAPTDLQSLEVKAKSWDGTMVPLSIVFKKGTKLDGSAPTILEGYGAYGITSDPYFDPIFVAWYERGGIIATAHVRGGGEYGEEWHLAGKKLTKPNTWKDAIACAQYLIDRKYTAASKLAILGGSAGGILVGRSITERPDLFAAAFDLVPDSDMVRSEFSPNGPPNIPETGTVTEAEGFKALYEMSAYHHIKDGTPYPAVMVTTGWNDPRVASWEPGKMAARLQAATSSGKLVLLRVDYDAGHGIGSTKTQRDELYGDIFSFALWQFGVAGFQPGAAGAAAGN
jgi:prolyl oligopeptidase